MSTEQLRALRDAANAHSLNDDVPATGKAAAHTLWLVCDRAIATLEAEVTKACDTKRVTSLITDLHEFLSRHSNRWDGESGKHPTVLDKECREVLAALEADGAAVCEEHQPAPDIVEDFSEYSPPLTPVTERKLVHGPEHGCAQPQQPARTAVPDAPPVRMIGHLIYGEGCSLADKAIVEAWVVNEKTRAAAQAIAAERDEWRERAEKAEAGLVALEGQEPVATLRYSAGWQVQWSASCQPFPGISLPVYARPVPADSSPREQHEAALAEARRDGLREALELVERDAKRMGSTWYDCRQVLTIAADGIRALMEVKP